MKKSISSPNFAVPAVSMTQEPSGAGIVFTAKDIETDTVDSSINDAGTALTITTEQGTIKIRKKDLYVSVAFHSRKEEKDVDKDGKEKTISVNSTTSSFGQITAKPVNLEQALVEYEKATKTLNINVPFAQEEKTARKIPTKIK
jgi:hypothetical protein